MEGECSFSRSRRILMNSIFPTSPLYVLLLPSRVGDSWIDRVRHAFFWNGTKSIHGRLCLINWQLVCSPNNQRGVRVCNLRAFNLALLFKWRRQLFHDTHTPWVAFILHNYYRRRRLYDWHSPLSGYVSRFLERSAQGFHGRCLRHQN